MSPLSRAHPCRACTLGRCSCPLRCQRGPSPAYLTCRDPAAIQVSPPHGVTGPCVWIQTLTHPPLLLLPPPLPPPFNQSRPCRGAATVFAAVGHGRSGSIAVLREGLLPDLVTEVPLAAVTGVWAVNHRTEGAEDVDLEEDGGAAGGHEDGADGGGGGGGVGDGAAEGRGSAARRPHHAYLLISREGRSTIVLETGDELQEITDRWAGSGSGSDLDLG